MLLLLLVACINSCLELGETSMNHSKAEGLVPMEGAETLFIILILNTILTVIWYLKIAFTN